MRQNSGPSTHYVFVDLCFRRFRKVYGEKIHILLSEAVLANAAITLTCPITKCFLYTMFKQFYGSKNAYDPIEYTLQWTCLSDFVRHSSGTLHSLCVTLLKIARRRVTIKIDTHCLTKILKIPHCIPNCIEFAEKIPVRRWATPIQLLISTVL